MKRDTTAAALPSIDELRRYHEGTLEEARVREIEMMSLSDPLLADALDGYSEMPAFDQVPPARSIQSGGTPWWHLGGWIGGLVVGGILAWIIFGAEEERGPERSVIHAPVEVHDTAVVAVDKTQIKEETEAWTESTSKQFAPSEMTKSGVDFADNEVIARGFPVILDSAEVRFIPMRGKGLDFGLSSAKPTDALVGKARRSMINDFIRIGYYHVADYSLLRKDARRPWAMSNGHVPANKENRTSESRVEELSTQQGYFDFLKQTLEFLTAKDYKSAESGFRLILSNYPDDVNGQFYLGRTLFLAAEYEQSIPYFEEARGNALSTFDEDAEFYSARAMQLSGNLQGALRAYERILSAEGFYTNQVRLCLAGLKTEKASESK